MKEEEKENLSEIEENESLPEIEEKENLPKREIAKYYVSLSNCKIVNPENLEQRVTDLENEILKLRKRQVGDGVFLFLILLNTFILLCQY